MKHTFLIALLTAAGLAAAAPARAETVRDLYARAMAQERLVRDDATRPTLAQMRRVVALYESLVRKHPASSYCDNALWQGANVASLAYERFGDEADRRTASRLLTLLKTGYPASKLLPQISTTMASLDKRTPAADLDSRSASESRPAPVTVPKPAVTDAPQKPKPDPATAGVITLRDVKRAVLP